MKLAHVIVVCVWAWVAVGCKDEVPRPAGGEAAGALNLPQLCRDGGATLNAATNECVCATAQRWNGSRCERAEASPESASPAPVVAGGASAGLAADGTRESAAIQVSGEAAATAASAAPVDAPLRRACRRAKGRWLAAEGFCLCAGDQVLVGAQCRTLPGRLTDDACLYAVHKGRWHAGVCACAEGEVFAPGRGGCARPVADDQATLRRECESSANRGRWDAAHARCACPAGRLWKDELCQRQFDLSSRDVCESAFNGGKWDEDHRRCQCPGSTQWLDQSCRPTATVSDQAGCESEQGGGSWSAALGKCICPRLGAWNPEALRCEE